MAARLLLIVGILLLSSLLAVPPNPASPTHRGPAISAAGDSQPPSAASGAHTETFGHAISASARARAIETELQARGVPGHDVHPPDLAAAKPGQGGLVSPTYTTAPAPMGVSDLGIRNVSGTLTPYDYTTPSFEGRAQFTRAQSVYVDGDGPDTFGFQLNAVATNVTVAGDSANQFWTQIFASYTSSAQELSLGDNVWNFSSASGDFPSGTLAAHGPNGTLVAPVFYYAVGPTFHIGYPFTLTFYLNSTTIGGLPTVFFNYTLSSGSPTISGSFDFVKFNAASGPTPTSLHFEVNGTGLNPIGLPNDAELVLVGNGGGDTTSFVGLNATFGLDYWNSTGHRYDSVPAAYDAGSDTGETSDGVFVSYPTAVLPTAPVADLALGPSFVTGLWNVSAAGQRTISDTLSPTNAFLLVTPGASFNASVAQWVPTFASTSGTTNFALPGRGIFNLTWLLSGHAPATFTVNGTLLPGTTTHLNTTLAASAATGVYTPLYAWGNAELGAISQAGAGTPTNPWVLDRRSVGPLSPAFASLNDFAFPVFSGVLLVNTSQSVRLIPPSLEVVFPSVTISTLDFWGLPTTDQLQLEFWNTANVLLWEGPAISGWLSTNLGFYPAAEALFWASRGDLIASNTFDDQGVAIALYGGGDNRVWDNTLLATPNAVTLPNATLGNGTNTTGLVDWESNDLVYDNYFGVPVGAVTPIYDAASCQVTCEPAEYLDTWNISRQSASNVTPGLPAFPSIVFTGSIIGGSYQGGNFWETYGSPADPFWVLPFNDAGAITLSGDYVPLYPQAIFSVHFQMSGLPAASSWGVTTLNATARTNLPTLALSAPNGTYPFTGLGPAGYVASSGTYEVNGSTVVVPVNFSPLYPVSFTEVGLVSGWPWSVAVTLTGGGPGGVTENSTLSADDFSLPNGSYSYAVAAVGYNATPATGSLSVSGSGRTTSIDFTLAPILQLHERGLPVGTPWSVEVTQGADAVRVTSWTRWANVTILDVSPGLFNWSVSATNFTSSPTSHGTGFAPFFGVLTLNFTAISGRLGGTIPEAGASVTVGGIPVSINAAGNFALTLGPGVHEIVATAPGYLPYYNNVTVQSNKTTNVYISMTSVPASASVPLWTWVALGVLAALAASGFALAMFRGRAPKAPSAARPPSSPPAGVGGVQPWEEGPDDAPGAEPAVSKPGG